MRKFSVISFLFVILLLLFGAGCDSQYGKSPGDADGDFKGFSAYSSYTPVRMDILPLTGLVSDDGGQAGPRIRVYASLLDAFDSQIKAPVVFRFELYEHVQRSAEAKGGRIFIWPDVDLTDAAANSGYWRDFLRAYEFGLNLEDPLTQDCIVLHVTALCPSGRRLSAELELKCRK